MKFGKSPARYYTHNGKQLISVTSILTLLSKGALIPWAANCAVDNILGRVADSFIDLETRQDYNTYGESVEYEWPIWGTKDFPTARTAYRQASIEAADYGTYIHTLCKYYFDGAEIVSEHEQTQKLMTSFYAWCKKHNVVPIETEVVVYGDGYAGRVDLICEIDCFWYKSKDKKDQEAGRRKRVVALIDFKTGKGSYYPEWPLQTAAYREAWNLKVRYDAIFHISKGASTVVMTETNKKLHREYCAKHNIQYHGVLKFNKETCRCNYKDMTPTYERDLQAFMLLVKFWEIMNES